MLIGDWINPDPKTFEFVVPEGIEAYKNPRLMVTAKSWFPRYPDAKWVVIERNPYDVANSMMQDKTRPQDEKFWLELQDRYVAEFDKTGIPEKNVLVVNYGMLCEMPQLTAKYICDFLDKPEKAEELGAWLSNNAKFKTYKV